MKSIKDFDLNQITKDKEYFPSPREWEDQTLYFLMVDRFSNGHEQNLYDPEKDYENALQSEDTKKEWLEAGDKWNGGTLQGIKSKLDYFSELGITAIWISPIFKQVAFEESYHGYGIQNFLAVDPHFGKLEDLRELVKAAHEKGIYIILDIILNHSGNVFTYEADNPDYTGEQFSIKAFNNSKGEPTIPLKDFSIDEVGSDGGIWPVELMKPETFSRKGQITNWDNHPEYIEGDFFSLKNIHTGSGELNNFTPSEALKVITECYKYWIAMADLDGFRLDTVKHLHPGATRYFLTEIHEFTKSIGKNNFYVIGEITGGMKFAIETMEKTGIDAALGINKVPNKLENVAKGYLDPDEFFFIFKNSELLGEDETKWYKDNVVTMFDDHDMIIQGGQKARFCADKDTAPLLLNALFLNLMSPGIPCLYYGTEQGFDGSGDSDKYVRETMFDGKFGAFRTMDRHFFNTENSLYQELSRIIQIRKDNIALKQGRLFQREISYDNEKFELPHKMGDGRHTGVVVWSRIFSQEEFLMAMNCNLNEEQKISAVVDGNLHQVRDQFECIYSTDSHQIGEQVEVVERDHKKVLQVSIPRAGCVVFMKNIQ
jgi:glycosidase